MLTLNRKKLVILILGIVIYFITTMSKILVPASIFDELLKTGTMSVAQISSLGSAFWYAYAASQLLAGLFSDRYGGVRVLLGGATLFVLGTLAFPWVPQYALVILCRAVAGFGAGTVFIGCAKIIADIFPEKFAFVLGLVLFITFLGYPCGTTPMVLLVKSAGWQWAMTLPGAIVLTMLAVILGFTRGTIQPARSGNALLPFYRMLHDGRMWALCISSGVIFAVYNIFLLQIGQKIFCDLYGFTQIAAANCILMLTFIVAAGNLGINLLLKLFGNRRKTASYFAVGCTLTGVIGGALCIWFHAPGMLLLAALVLIAIPAGFFPLFSTMGKELNPPENAGLAVSIVNFSATTVIGLFQSVTGTILNRFPLQSGAFPLAAYRWSFVFMLLTTLLAAILFLFIPETGKRSTCAKNRA